MKDAALEASRNSGFALYKSLEFYKGETELRERPIDFQRKGGDSCAKPPF